MSAALRKRRLASANLALTAAVSTYSFWLASDRTWNPDVQSKYDLSRFFFWSQARYLLRGHLYVATPRGGWSECFAISHKCVGYFGVTPSILRIPLVAVFRDHFEGLVPVMIAIAIGLAFWAAMDLVRMVFERYASAHPGMPPWFQVRWFVLIGALLGPGSVLMLVARARVFEEAVAWCTAFLCLALNLVYRWSRSRSRPALWGALAAGCLAASARPSAIPALVVLGIAVVVISWRWGDVWTRLLGVALVVVPTALYVFVFVAKFGSLSFPWKSYGWYVVDRDHFRRTIDANDGGTVGLRYALSTLANYFRPDSLNVDLTEPAVTLKPGLVTMPPVRSIQLWGGNVPSLTNLMPAPLVFTGIALVHHARLLVAKKLRLDESMPAFMLLAGLAAGVPMIMYYALAGRYLDDLYPLMAVGTAFALPIVVAFASRDRWWHRAVFPVLVVTAVVSIFVLYEVQASAF